MASDLEMPIRIAKTSHFGLCVYLIAIVMLVGVCSADAATGYDENTEIVIKGRVAAVNARSFSGLNCFTLEFRNRMFRVITAPPWFLRRIGFSLKPGQKIRVRGSKFFGRDGGLYILARSLQIVPKGRKIVFRDRDCKPIWRNAGIKESSCIRIFYCPPRPNF